MSQKIVGSRGKTYDWLWNWSTMGVVVVWQEWDSDLRNGLLGSEILSPRDNNAGIKGVVVRGGVVGSLGVNF